jgi:rhodanese-related sulfurtransferase
LYCAAGIRSAMAGSSLKILGYKNIFNLGGFIDLLGNQ